MNNAVEIFESINDKDTLKQLTHNVGKEDLYIDFKGVYDSKGEFCDSCKKNLGKGLSGFANSAGGVLIFGVKEDKPNQTFILSPIANVKRFDQRVQEYINRLTSNSVPGVVSKIIHDSDDSGYVVVLIPRSDEAPHQFVQDKKYYRRSGESFLPMEHFELENMFGRSPIPVLIPDISVVESGSTDQRIDYNVILGIRNIGTR